MYPVSKAPRKRNFKTSHDNPLQSLSNPSEKEITLMSNLKYLFCDLKHCFSASISSEIRNWWLPLVLSQLSSVAQSCPTLCNPMDSSMPGLPVHPQLPEPTQTHVRESVTPSSHLLLCCPLLLLPSIFPTTVQKHQFFGAQLSSQANSHIHT